MSFSVWPSFTKEEADAVARVLLSNRVNYWTGTEGREFEKEFAAFCGCRYAVALANGTVALELALRALGVGQGDEVIVPCYTFIATASAVVACGAVPVMADIDSRSLTITAETVSQRLGPKTKGIIVVHLTGWPCDMDPIMELAKEHGLKVVEDCAQAHGASYKGRAVGTIGDIGAWSFCQDKIMTTGGEGGMVTTNSEVLWKKMWSYKDHGKSWEAVHERLHPEGFRWVHETFGTNARMTEMQAAIGRVQLQRMPEWQERRRKNAAVLIEGFTAVYGIDVYEPPADVVHAYYKFYAFLNDEIPAVPGTRDAVMAGINASGVPCFSGICPEIYLEKAFGEMVPAMTERLPVASGRGQRSLMFLVHPTLGEDEMRQTVDVVQQVLSGL